MQAHIWQSVLILRRRYAPYDLHQAFYRWLCPYPSRLLWREEQGLVLVQSVEAHAWRDVDGMVRMVHPVPLPEAGMRIRFAVKAEAVCRSEGRIVRRVPIGAARGWLEQRLRGLEVKRLEVRPYFKPVYGKNGVVIRPYIFQGEGLVCDADALGERIRAGIGRSKYIGLGLMQWKVIS